MTRHSISPIYPSVSVYDPAASSALTPSMGDGRFTVRHPASHSLFRPISIFLLGLAFAVFLWGLSYKLSLYHSHQGHLGRTGVAKLWIGPVPGKLRTSSAKVLAWPPPHRQLNLFATSYPSQSSIQRCAAFVPADKESHFRLRVLRSPPPLLL
jgi:hypothetical protein